MTPGARLSAAMTVLDAALTGEPLEKALTGWARASRYAGSGDRAAVRDLVYDAWRCRRSFAALGGAETGRGLVIGGLRARGEDPARLMTGEGHAPPPPGADEAGRAPLPGPEAFDLPDWIWPLWQEGLGDGAEAAARVARHRAPVFLRVNLAQVTRDGAADALRAEGIGTRAHDHVKTALEVTDNARKVARSAPYLRGLVEVQDASSQAAVAALPLADGQRVLDFCAGGGGKALALADRAAQLGWSIDLWAHDASPARLRDLPVRAARAGATIRIADADPQSLGAFDLVLVDAPCSGSGTWRRDPDGKWRLTPARLAELKVLQAGILGAASARVADRGVLAYATCSVLSAETERQVAAFVERHPGWRIEEERVWHPTPQGDGFSLATLRRLA